MNIQEENWYEVTNIANFDTPALLFYPERIQSNITIASNIIRDDSLLRPHVKTHKCGEVTRMMMNAGVNKFKCATIAEAEMLAMNQAADVLLAYQPVGIKINRFLQLIKTYPNTKFSCLVDNEASLNAISKAAVQENVIIHLFIDVDTGMHRTGILPEQTLQLYRLCLDTESIVLLGFHAYDGHINTTDLEQRTKECYAGFNSLSQLVMNLTNDSKNRMVIVAGGTPTFPIYAQMDSVECSPGTFILYDHGYQQSFPDLPFLPAALVVTRVIAVLDEYTVCLDLGHKAIAAENCLDHRIRFLNAPGVVFIGHSEEHLVISTKTSHQLKLGDVLYGLPVHICPTCALYDIANIVVDRKMAGEWKIIARNRKITI